jgi:hypothetical protein
MTTSPVPESVMTRVSLAKLQRMMMVLEGPPGSRGLMHDEQQDVAKVAIPLMRFVDQARPELRRFHEGRLRLLKQKFNGSLPSDPEEAERTVREALEQDEDFQRKMEELFNTEVEINVAKIDPLELRGVSAFTLLEISPILQTLHTDPHG